MKISKSVPVVLLAVWLILIGVMQLANITLPLGEVIQGALAIITGVLILLRPISLSRSIGVILLAVWLLLTGLLAVTNLTFPARELIMALLAMSAGVTLLIAR